VKRAYMQYERLPDAVWKYVYLTTLHDRNEVLFYRLFSEHLREMIPIFNELAASVPIDLYRRRPKGVYLSIDQIDSIEDAFSNLGLGPDDVDLVLATDAEHIPGIGDWGVGGLELAIGKLAIYTAAGGIDPSRVIPVMLDVGTNRDGLLGDELYLGKRNVRVVGDRYNAFIDAYVNVVKKLFPKALLQWEHFAPANGRRIIQRYNDEVCTFNEDIQGTGAITLAAVISALRVCGTPLRNQRVVIFGSGAAGIGVADQLRDAMVRDGLSQNDASRQFWCLDRKGLLTSDMAGDLRQDQASYARPAAESCGWKCEENGNGISLAEVVRRVKPTILVGAATVPGSFTEPIVRTMAANTERPIIIVLCNPASRAAANPSDLIAWTEGRALIATGSAFPPVTYRGVTYVIGQVNNAMLYPGLALGAIVSRASRISDGMFVAAASAVSSLVTVRQPGASLLPHIDDLRSVAVTVAAAVAEAAEAGGWAGTEFTDIVQQVRDAMWEPAYRSIEAI
jgi:malate dehydrogenase (oxaloacetate-decarboxylating)